MSIRGKNFTSAGFSTKYTIFSKFIERIISAEGMKRSKVNKMQNSVPLYKNKDNFEADLPEIV